jgi:hypothetical protein
VGRTRRDQIVEGVEVHLLLRLHMPQQVPLAAAPEDRELAGVDARGAVLPGVVHTDHAVQGARRVARQARTGHRTGGLSRRDKATNAASARLNSRFICAIDTGRNGIK